MLLGVEGFAAAALAERLDKLVFSEDVQVKNITGELAELGVHGPTAAGVLERITGVPAERLQAMAQYDNISAQRKQAPAPELTIVRDDAFGVFGFDIYAAPTPGVSISYGQEWIPLNGKPPAPDSGQLR